LAHGIDRANKIGMPENAKQMKSNQQKLQSTIVEIFHTTTPHITGGFKPIILLEKWPIIM